MKIRLPEQRFKTPSIDHEQRVCRLYKSKKTGELVQRIYIYKTIDGVKKLIRIEDYKEGEF